MDLLPEKKSYQPGDIAKFQVRMPFRFATALVAVEREGVLHTEVVQLNGKLVDRVPAPAEASREQLEEIARGSGKLAARLNGKQIVKAVVVPGKLVNFVVK